MQTLNGLLQSSFYATLGEASSCSGASDVASRIGQGEQQAVLDTEHVLIGFKIVKSEIDNIRSDEDNGNAAEL